jgi:hypothetical protein
MAPSGPSQTVSRPVMIHGTGLLTVGALGLKSAPCVRRRKAVDTCGGVAQLVRAAES